MRVKCPECKEPFDLSVNDYDEGDSVECPECSSECTVTVKGGKLKLASEKEKYYDADDEFYGEEEEE
ncbi:MAG: hypothetical protein V1676_07550 [Candidatus Diapherotrites archaeon]